MAGGFFTSWVTWEAQIKHKNGQNKQHEIRWYTYAVREGICLPKRDDLFQARWKFHRKSPLNINLQLKVIHKEIRQSEGEQLQYRKYEKEAQMIKRTNILEGNKNKICNEKYNWIYLPWNVYSHY